MKPKPKTRARVIVTAEGTYVHVEDFKRELMDDTLIMECAALIVVAKDHKLPALLGIRLAIGNALNEVTGVNDALKKQTAIRLVIEDGGETPEK